MRTLFPFLIQIVTQQVLTTVTPQPHCGRIKTVQVLFLAKLFMTMIFPSLLPNACAVNEVFGVLHSARCDLAGVEVLKVFVN